MEFIGRIVDKEFKGYGVYSGVVQSYDPSSGFFEIVYEDGDSEELDFSEVVSLLERKEAVPVDHKHRLGRRPKKRRRLEPRKRENQGQSGNSISRSQPIEETLGRPSVVEANVNFDMNRNVDLNDGFTGDLGEGEIANGNLRNMNVDLNEALEKGGGLPENLGELTSVNGSLNGNGSLKEALDLNAGFNLNLNEGFDLNEEDGINGNVQEHSKKMECIDLNLDVNENLREVDLGNNHLESQKKDCGFDLNLGIDDEIKDGINGDSEGVAKEIISCEMVKEETQKKESRALEGNHIEGAIANGTLLEVHVSTASCLGFVEGIWKKDIFYAENLIRDCDSVEVQGAKTVMKGSPEVIDGSRCDMDSACEDRSGGQRRRRRRRNISDGLNSTPETMVFTDANVIYGSQDDIISVCKEGNGSQRRSRRAKIAGTLNSTSETTVIVDADVVKEDSTMLGDQKQGDMESTCKVVTGGRRKRRKLSDDVNAAPEMTVLRRSTRRGSAKNDILTSTTLNVADDLSVSPAVSALTEEKPMKSCHEWPREPVVLPPKAQLPPSSQNLDLSGISISDFFSVYACLRSFSTLLFLSPFELEEFVAALKCNSPSALFDCIHVSVLQTLRKHLECLSNEGSESASNCLRSLDWDLLDLNTWPVFMVEYLLIHGSDLKPGFDLTLLKLLKSDYYKQSVSVKVEILRCLCDDMIEVEAIRSELNRRSSGSEFDLDFDRNTTIGALKKKRAGMDLSGGSCITEDAVDDSTDWNSDECCLCKMDGSLICCDGCPAAYHSKCVGVANDSLPEGDWFCPECAIDRHKPWMKPRKSLRGAELFGVDPYGRLYFSSCGYLLVSDSCETESSFNYYHRDDLNAVVEVLRSSGIVYSSILDAIHKHWDLPVSFYEANNNPGSLNHALCSDTCMAPAVLASSETCVTKNETVSERKLEEKFVTGCSGHINVEVSKALSQTCASSEGSAETIQTSLENQNFCKEGPDCSNRSTDFLNVSYIPGKLLPMGDNSLTSACLDLKIENIRGSPANGNPSSAYAADGNASQLQSGFGYLNFYSFGHIASSVAEELMRKTSDKAIEDPIKSDEEIISAQMKIISKKTAKFRWPNIPRLNANVHKEKCGWCYCCRVSSDDLGCLFNVCLGPVQAGSVDEVVGLQSKRNKKADFTDLISYILLIEERLQGLLLGPWLNPHYSKLWCKSVLRASDIVSVKSLLLTLESNLHRLALSAEWLKYVDSAATMGSASHIVIASSRASSKNGIGRKRARYSELDSNPSLNSASGLGMLWWRGGRISRRLFSWKILPSSLVSKAARRAGCMKIPGIFYPENSDFAKRSKYVSWRAAVESSTTVEQLALQVRDLDSNIKWDEIGNINPLSLVDKESKKSIRLFKKVIVRRKCAEGEGAKYLLDFGKRRIIPEIVTKNGSMVEESSSVRKKYWLNESYVPLYLLKSFEEKRIARRSSKVSSGKLSDAVAVVKKSSKRSGFSYLFAKAERSEYHQCGHCNKDVPIREAICCQYCKGFFHKRHVRKSAGSIAAECTYTCHQCLNGKHVKSDSKTGKSNAKRGKNIIRNAKVQHQKSKRTPSGCKSVLIKNNKKVLRSSRSLRSQKNKKVTIVVPLRRSPRKAKYNSLQNKKVGGSKKGKKVKSKKAMSKKPAKVTSFRKKRTENYHSYWLNGLFLSRKPGDERVMHFRSKKFLAPSESVSLDQHKCPLCHEAGYTSTLNYISCEMCGEWFHGDAFGLNVEKSNRLIGFRCHVCRKSTPPVCPFLRSHESETAQDQNDVGNEFSEQANNIPHLSGINLLEESLGKDEDQRDSFSVDESVHGKEQFGATLDSDKTFAPRSRLEVGYQGGLGDMKVDIDAIQISNDNLNPESISCNENHMPKEKTIESRHDSIVTSHDQMQSPSCNVDVNVIETEQASSEHVNATDNLKTPILKSPIDGVFLESVELHPHSFMATTEL
ncbi:hypothetical protein JCGZ_25964 [Jatropha curcas]|uniref:PHD-type domain-containing protein n=1 Tax=Jatropha curcas TaxID=180498 RepID=A0A067JH50_JATCU|nr:hypothetical protein JCGZ_25964 [Jatropha curcas]